MIETPESNPEPGSVWTWCNTWLVLVIRPASKEENAKQREIKNTLGVNYYLVFLWKDGKAKGTDYWYFPDLNFKRLV